MNTVCKSDQARNHPIYVVDQDFGCFELSKTIETDIWKLYFDGSCSKEGAGAGIVLISVDK